MIATLKRTWRLLDKPLRRRWLQLGPLAAISAGLEALAIASVYVLIRLADEPQVAQYSQMTRWLQGRLAIDTDTQLLAVFALVVAALYVLKNSLRLLIVYLRSRLVFDATNQLSADLLSAYLHAPYRFHLQQHSAQLMHNVQDSVATIAQKVVDSSTVIVAELMIVIAVVAVLVRSAPTDALLAAGGVSGIMMLFLWLTQRQHLRWGEQNHHLGIAHRSLLQEGLTGIKEVKTLGMEAAVLDRFSRQRQQLSNIGLHRSLLEAIPHIVVETFLVLVLVALIWTLRENPSHGDRMLPLIALFGYAGLRLLPSLHWLVYHSNNLRFAETPVAALAEDWRHLPSHSPARDHPSPQHQPSELALHDVSLRFDGADRDALSAINLRLSRGEKLAIVGTTGAGKSTLMDTLLGLIQPDSGRYQVDGVDFVHWQSRWPQLATLVPQQVFLLDASVRDNITAGLDARQVSDEQALQALHLAQLGDWLQALPSGLDTPVGENGVRLSGGERQRLALARSLYRDAPLLFLDEPTSALDSQTETAIADVLEQLQRTLVVITHRPALARRFNRIIWLDNGRIRGDGSFENLAAADPAFLNWIQA